VLLNSCLIFLQTGISNLNRLTNNRATYQGSGVQDYSDNNFTVNEINEIILAFVMIIC
jgi:hypothetical protein